MSTVKLLIASYREPEQVTRHRRVDARLHVIYEPSLLGAPRYAADHSAPHTRTPADEVRWRKLLAQADILFDFDHTNRADLPDLAPHVRWLQATSAGIGQFVRTQGYDRRMPQTIFTTASGVHARPLAEFCAMAMLTHSRDLATMQRQQDAHHWQRYAGSDLAGRTLAVIGVGRIGSAVARLGQALGLHVIGVKRTVAGVIPADLGCHELFGPDQLHAVLRSQSIPVLRIFLLNLRLRPSQ
jgi:phosphoglycerate dehydrogenase-like enzyme